MTAKKQIAQNISFNINQKTEFIRLIFLTLSRIYNIHLIFILFVDIINRCVMAKADRKILCK